MKKLYGYLRKISIRQRLLFGFILLPLVVMIICFISYYYFSVQMMLTKNKESSTQSVSMVEEIFHLNTFQIEEQMSSFTQNQRILDFLMDAKNEDVAKEMKTYMQESKYLRTRSEMFIFSAEGNLLYQETTNQKTTKPKGLTRQQRVNEWSYVGQNNSMYLTRKITYQDNVIGYVSVVFDEEAFSTAFAKTGQSNNMMIIIDKDNQYLFGQADFEKGTYIDTSKDSVQIDQQKYYQVTKAIDGIDWKVVNLVGDSYILEEMHNFRNMLLIYGMFIVLIEMMISTLIFNSIYDPIHHILNSMRGLDEVNLPSRKVLDEGKDEIHELSDNFNDLLSRVQELLETVEMEQVQKRETQIELLQAQINPHFLFNTLNTLNYLAILNEDNPVSEGIGALSKLLRNTIVDCKEYVDVIDEIENVKNYVVIQKLRFGDLFETVYNIDEAVRHCQILKFLLQPIVENSILHAFEEDREHQLLTIRAKSEGIYLKIEIGDNGKGFELQEGIPDRGRLSGIGIMNIQERIRLMYGDRYAMTIQSELGKGTIVTLRLPLKKGGNSNV